MDLLNLYFDGCVLHSLGQFRIEGVTRGHRGSLLRTFLKATRKDLAMEVEIFTLLEGLLQARLWISLIYGGVGILLLQSLQLPNQREVKV